MVVRDTDRRRATRQQTDRPSFMCAALARMRVVYVHELLNALCQVFFQTEKRLVVTQFLHSLEFDLADSFTRVTQDFPGFF